MLSWLKKRFQRLPVFWRFQLTGWGLFMIFGYLMRLSAWETKAMALLMTLLMEPLAMLISTGLRWIYSRLRLRLGLSVGVAVSVVFFSGVASVIETGAAGWGAPFIAQLVGHPMTTPSLLSRWCYFWLVFSGWSVAYLWMKAEFQSRLKQAQLHEATAAAQRAELQMLRLQLNPHFMFNALNNIATEIPEQPETALEMTHDLAEFLRYSLDHRAGLIVPLAREVEAMTSYLNIEQRRFGERLRFTVNADQGALKSQVPCFLLQPLVENAVKHGLNSSLPPWELGVEVASENGDLCVKVRNTGRLAPDWETRPESGTGVMNLRRRLELHFPARHRFQLRQEGPQVCSEVILTGEPCQV